MFDRCGLIYISYYEIFLVFVVNWLLIAECVITKNTIRLVSGFSFSIDENLQLPEHKSEFIINIQI